MHLSNLFFLFLLQYFIIQNSFSVTDILTPKCQLIEKEKISIIPNNYKFIYSKLDEILNEIDNKMRKFNREVDDKFTLPYEITKLFDNFYKSEISEKIKNLLENKQNNLNKNETFYEGIKNLNILTRIVNKANNFLKNGKKNNFFRNNWK